MVTFLEALGLSVIDLQLEGPSLTGEASPSVIDTVIAGFSAARAVVVLFTPDEDVTLRPEFRANPEEQAPRQQARPNVYFEAGYAFRSHPKRTVLVELGRVSPISDLGDRLAVRNDDSEHQRRAVIVRLMVAGCAVDDQDETWRTAGSFLAAIGVEDGSG
jgi:hypothetical protein